VFYFPPHATFDSALLHVAAKNRPSKIRVDRIVKKFHLSRIPHLWLQTVSRLQGLTILIAAVCLMFRNVYEFKKRLVKSALVRSGTLG